MPMYFFSGFRISKWHCSEYQKNCTISGEAQYGMYLSNAGCCILWCCTIAVRLCTTLAMLNIELPEPKNSGSNADDPINLAHLLGMLHIVDLICWP
jgi:hypothetical protein